MQWQELRSHIRHLAARDITRIGQAFELGNKMHEGQKRQSGEPYFNHPIAVAHILLDLQADADTVIAALLHDTVEDTPLTLADIDRDFDGSVTALIDGVTKLILEDVVMRPKLDEQIETLRKIFTLMQQDIRIMVIKIVDRLHNMQTVEFLPIERQRLLAKETIEVFVKIADKLCMQDMRDQLESLCLAVLEPEAHAALLEIRNMNEQRGALIVEQIRGSLHEHDRILSSKTDLVFEHKIWDQMKAQRSIGESVATGVSFITVALVCENIDACYRTLGALHQLWKREILSFQDFINAPQLNGYRGLHTTVIMQDGTRVRCKIRTKEMHEYARQGVTTVCFKGKTEISEILPWTKHLSSLTTDTEGSSNDFWENLKSDILGESIIIHGPDDSTVQLPRGSTALDGAFYLLKEEALKTKQIKVNGTEVAFSTPLTNAASIDIVLDAHETCNREWLGYVQTGFAAAKIRMALAKQSEKKKLSVGRSMLQEFFTERKRGFIQEFNEKTLETRLHGLGLSSIKDVYISIADGRLDPTEVYDALFQKSESKHSKKFPATLVQYNADMESFETMDRINLVHRKYGTALSDIRYRRLKEGGGAMSLLGHMSPQDLMHLQQDLAMAGAEHIKICTHHLTTVVLIVCILLLWGLDPVVAHYLLNTVGVQAIDLTIVRFLSLTIMSSVLLFWHHIHSPLRQTPLPLRSKSLWLSVFALVIVSLSSYLSLEHTLPLQYTIPMTAAGVVLTSIVNHRRSRILVATWVLVFTGIVILIISSPDWSAKDIVFTFIAILSFSAFTVISERYKRQEYVGARAAQYFFVLSLFCALFTTPLLFMSTIKTLSVHTLMLMALFSIVFAGLPYYIYYYLLSHKQIDFVLRSSFMIIFVTAAGQILLLHNNPLTPAVLLAILFVIAGAVLPLLPQRKKYQLHANT